MLKKYLNACAVLLSASMVLPFPSLAKDPIVYVAGPMLKNQSREQADDVRVSIRIPCVLCIGEVITGGFINIGGKITEITNEGLSGFDSDIFLERKYDPGEIVDLSATIFSRKTNGMRFDLKHLALTDEAGHSIATQVAAGGFKVAPPASKFTSSVTQQTEYTFYNDGTDVLFVKQIDIGRSPVLLKTFSSSDLSELMTFDNGGVGWNLAQGEELTFELPYLLKAGEFLLAHVAGTAAIGTSDAMDVDYFQGHEAALPETSTWATMLIGFAMVGRLGRRGNISKDNDHQSNLRRPGER